MHPNADSMTVSKGLKIKWKGLFNFDELYKRMKYWLDYKGYGDETKTFKEEKYLERIKAEGKEINIRWKAEKIVNDYFSFVINITFVLPFLQSVQIEKEGKKISANKGSMTITLGADLIKNRSGKFSKDSVIKKIYENFIIKSRIDSQAIDLYEQLYKLHDDIKAFLEMQRF